MINNVEVKYMLKIIFKANVLDIIQSTYITNMCIYSED